MLAPTLRMLPLPPVHVETLGLATAAVGGGFVALVGQLVAAAEGAAFRPAEVVLGGEARASSDEAGVWAAVGGVGVPEEAAPVALVLKLLALLLAHFFGEAEEFEHRWMEEGGVFFFGERVLARRVRGLDERVLDEAVDVVVLVADGEVGVER